MDMGRRATTSHYYYYYYHKTDTLSTRLQDAKLPELGGRLHFASNGVWFFLAFLFYLQ